MSKSIQAFLKKESQPMQQATYWVLFIATGGTFMLKTVEVSALRSYEILEVLPELAQYSGLTASIFF